LAELVRDRADAAAIVRAHRGHAYSMRQIATHLGCDVTTVHRRVRI
jgi:DNA-directed RNA polymerase specialized sigma24 family protein